jgi:hypothetical protein
MPSEKEIEEAVWHVYNHEDNDGGIGTLGSARVLLDAYLSMKSERDEALRVIEERSTRWEHEEDSYAIDASRLAVKLSATESERDKYKEIVEKDMEALDLARVVISNEDDAERDLGCNDPDVRKYYNDAIDLIDSALSLRDKKGSR